MMQRREHKSPMARRRRILLEATTKNVGQLTKELGIQLDPNFEVEVDWWWPSRRERFNAPHPSEGSSVGKNSHGEKGLFKTNATALSPNRINKTGTNTFGNRRFGCSGVS